MSSRELPPEVVKMNKKLCEFWVDEVDMLKIHQNTSLQTENRVVSAVNATYNDRSRWASILRGFELRSIYGYPDD